MQHILHFVVNLWCEYIDCLQRGSSLPSPFHPFAIMSVSVSAKRLQWLAYELSCGRNCCVSFSYNAATKKEKIKFVLFDGYCLVGVYRPCLLGAMSAATLAIDCSITTDKGHRSSGGSTTVEFWIKQPPIEHPSETHCSLQPGATEHSAEHCDDENDDQDGPIVFASIACTEEVETSACSTLLPVSKPCVIDASISSDSNDIVSGGPSSSSHDAPDHIYRPAVLEIYKTARSSRGIRGIMDPALALAAKNSPDTYNELLRIMEPKIKKVISEQIDNLAAGDGPHVLTVREIHMMKGISLEIHTCECKRIFDFWISCIVPEAAEKETRLGNFKLKGVSQRH